MRLGETHLHTLPEYYFNIKLYPPQQNVHYTLLLITSLTLQCCHHELASLFNHSFVELTCIAIFREVSHSTQSPPSQAQTHLKGVKRKGLIGNECVCSVSLHHLYISLK